MCNTPRARDHGNNDSYIEQLEKTIRLTESLQRQLLSMKHKYPIGDYTKRDVHRIRSCVLCALETFLFDNK